MADPNISIRLNAETLARIDELAAKLDRSRNWVVSDMLQSSVDAYEEQIALLEQRLQEAESGTVPFIPHANLDLWMASRRQKE
ncbi:MAG: ribbon-helix-helix protein, CopG family [Chloroflexota bacterium]|nr:ribbon-helix-helix protein, CopG family [Chloroflexota bacterium]